MMIIILAFCVSTWQVVLGQTSCTAPFVPNAKPLDDLAESYPSGGFVRYVCDDGYEFVDTRYVLCENGTWNLPVCKLETSCTWPLVPNAEFAEDTLAAIYPSGSSVRFSCDRGYEFEGTKYARCVSGTWKLPVCKILDGTTCAAPQVPNAQPAHALLKSYSSADTVRFVCNSGYRFEETDSAQCEDGGVWRLPVCKGQTSCPTPFVPNAEPLGDLAESYPAGFFLEFVCDGGYEFAGTHHALCEDGIWILPVCKHVKSCLAPRVPNAHPADELKTVYGPGETLKFICNSSYEFEGTHYALCDDGTWSLPACRHGQCAPPSVSNGKPEGELSASYPTGSTVKFVCDDNHEMEASQYAMCEGGTWRLPVCKGTFLFQ